MEIPPKIVAICEISSNGNLQLTDILVEATFDVSRGIFQIPQQ